MRSSLVSDANSAITIYRIVLFDEILDSTFFCLDTVFSLLQYFCNQKYQPQPWSLLHTAHKSWKVEIPTLKVLNLEKNQQNTAKHKVQKWEIITIRFPVNNETNYLETGAGFLSSAISPMSQDGWPCWSRFSPALQMTASQVTQGHAVVIGSGTVLVTSGKTNGDNEEITKMKMIR